MSVINKMEVLRAICFSNADYEQIQNFGLSFSDAEINTMIDFKKIHDLGLGKDGYTGLKRFISRLLYDGYYNLDDYTINYFVKQLLNGPFRDYVIKYTREDSVKYFFRKSPDIMGCLGESPKNVLAPSNTSLVYIEGGYMPLGTFPTISYKIPDFMNRILKTSTKITEGLFRGSMASTWAHDNTLPCKDKNPQDRVDEEPLGGYDYEPIANFGIKDATDYHNVTKPLVPYIQGSVKRLLLLTDYERCYLYKKMDNRFEENSTSSNYVVDKEIVENGISQVTSFDLTGDEFETDENRSSVLIVNNDSKNEKFALNTNIGQLGN